MFELRRSARFGIALAFLASLLAGCGSTTLQARKAELAVLAEASAATEKVLARIEDQSLPPDYDVHLFVSFATLNSVLTAIDGYKTIVPGLADASLEIAQVRVGSIGALPSATVAAKVRKNDLEVEVDIGIVLNPITLESGIAALQFRVVHFIPRVQWWIFEVSKIQFVRSLLSVEVDKLTRKLPVVELPFDTSIEFGGPEVRTRLPVETGNESTLEVEVVAPSTTRSKILKVLDYVFIGGGMHVFGRLE